MKEIIMKRIQRTTATILVAMLLFVNLFVPASAGIGTQPSPQPFESNDNESIVRFLQSQAADPSFGGMFYEGDTLVVNVLDRAFVQNLEPLMRSGNYLVEYRYVQNPLSFLENVKDFLTPYMDQFAISSLDANEVTNCVDIALQDYSDDILDSIQTLTVDHFQTADFLNFIDHSSYTVQSTVAYEHPEYSTLYYTDYRTSSSLSPIPNVSMKDFLITQFMVILFMVISLIFYECTANVGFLRDAKANISARLSAKHLSRTQKFLLSRAHFPLFVIVVLASFVFPRISLPVGILILLIIAALPFYCILILISEAAQDLRKKDK